MKVNLMKRLFGPGKRSKVDASAVKRAKTLTSVNESETTAAKPRARRTVGLTEQRLRARNKQSWMTSTKGWSDFFGRFVSAKR